MLQVGLISIVYVLGAVTLGDWLYDWFIARCLIKLCLRKGNSGDRSRMLRDNRAKFNQATRYALGIKSKKQLEFVHWNPSSNLSAKDLGIKWVVRSLYFMFEIEWFYRDCTHKPIVCMLCNQLLHCDFEGFNHYKKNACCNTANIFFMNFKC